MVTKEIITVAVSVSLSVPIEDIKKSDRSAGAREDNVRFARQLCMWLCRKYKLGTLSSIGAYYNRDHATVIHACNVITNEINISKERGNQVREIIEKIRNATYYKIFEDECDKFINILRKEHERFIKRTEELKSVLMLTVENIPDNKS